MIWRWRPMTVERLTSGWMYWPPVMCHCSSSTSRRTRPKSSGSIRSACSKSQDSPRVKTNSGYSSQRSAAERNVASASSTPACQDHSHTGSMWALPIMWTITKRPISYVCLRLFLLNYRRRLWPAPKDVLPGLSLDGSGRQGADDEPLQDDEGGDGRQHGQHPARGDHLGRGLGVVALEIEDADRDREQRGFTQEYVRHNELSPGEDSREHEHRGEARQDERQNDPQERAEARAAVNHGRLVEGWGYAVEEPLQHPGRKRHQDGDVDHRRAEMRVEQVQPGEVPVERYDDDQRRYHLQGEDADQQRAVATEVQAGECVGRRGGDHHSADATSHGEFERVDQEHRELRRVEDLDVVLQRGGLGDQAQRRDVDLLLGSDRKGEYPEQRPAEEHQGDGEHQVGQQVADPAPGLAAPHTAPSERSNLL